MEQLKQLLNDWGWLANLLEIIGSIVLAWTAFNTHILRTEQNNDKKKITLVLQVENQATKSYTLPGTINRSEFTRAEILGRLGMIRRKDDKEKFFKLDYVQKNPLFLAEIQKIYDSKADAIMIIHCNAEEFEQFQF